MNLRPHHILCIQKFTGQGYNADFTAHMKSIVSELANKPKTQITLLAGKARELIFETNEFNNICTCCQ